MTFSANQILCFNKTERLKAILTMLYGVLAELRGAAAQLAFLFVNPKYEEFIYTKSYVLLGTSSN